jgi:LysM repeat protein
MSRKDMIIVSLLINAGILALLFLFATSPDDTVGEAQHGMAPLAEALAEHPVSSPKKEPLAPIAQEEEDFDVITRSFLADESDAAFGHEEERYIPLEKQPEKIVQQAAGSPEKMDSSPAPEYIEIKVKKGDALEKIARNNGTTVEAIKQANQLTSVKLSIGQTLRIPVEAKRTAAQQGTSDTIAAAPPKANEPQYHVIKFGDSPWKIAKQYQVSVEDILKLNEMDEAQARNLKIGEKIRVR